MSLHGNLDAGWSVFTCAHWLGWCALWKSEGDGVMFHFLTDMSKMIYVYMSNPR